MEKLKSVWQALSPQEKKEMAGRLLTNTAYLSQIAHGWRKPGKHLKIALDQELEKHKGAA